MFPFTALGSNLGSYQAVLEGLKEEPSAKISSQEGWTVIQTKEQANVILWTFTPDSHPAHPAFAKRTLIQSDAGWNVKTELSCDGPKTECDKLLLEYKALDEQIKNRISSKMKQSNENKYIRALGNRFKKAS